MLELLRLCEPSVEVNEASDNEFINQWTTSMRICEMLLGSAVSNDWTISPASDMTASTDLQTQP